MKWVAHYASQRFELEAETLEEAAGKAFAEFDPLNGDNLLLDLENNDRHYTYEFDGHEMQLIDECAQDRRVRVTLNLCVPLDEMQDIKDFIKRRGPGLDVIVESFEVLPNV